MGGPVSVTSENVPTSHTFSTLLLESDVLWVLEGVPHQIGLTVLEPWAVGCYLVKPTKTYGFSYISLKWGFGPPRVPRGHPGGSKGPPNRENMSKSCFTVFVIRKSSVFPVWPRPNEHFWQWFYDFAGQKWCFFEFTTRIIIKCLGPDINLDCKNTMKNHDFQKMLW